MGLLNSFMLKNNIFLNFIHFHFKCIEILIIIFINFYLTIFYLYYLPNNLQLMIIKFKVILNKNYEYI